MDTEPLVDRLIEDGQRVAEEIAQHGFPVSAAIWLQRTDDEKWYYYIISPIVDSQGLASAYGQLHPAVQGLRGGLGINPLAIRLIGPSNPIAQDVLAALRRFSGRRVSPIRWNGTWLGDVSIENAYLYSLPVTTP